MSKHGKIVIAMSGGIDSCIAAMILAVKCGYSHWVLGIRKEFGNHVIDNFVVGSTPNPCVLCNTYIKYL